MVVISTPQTISIHAPARGATLSLRLVLQPDQISIHAPARGATGYNMHQCRTPQISIHAPARGATCSGFNVRYDVYTDYFNPRTRTGCDFMALWYGIDVLISIHAPARGATAVLILLIIEKIFQSTHPHGVRLVNVAERPEIVISIHAPARGATHFFTQSQRQDGISIHAPARGATIIEATMTKGITPQFQSTHPHGVRLHGVCHLPLLPDFNPRTRTGCDVK